jgi:O-antigen/teichoic acid export membrane protein
MTVRNAVLFTSISAYLGRLISLISVMIIARMLSPEELGVYAIAASLVLIVSELNSFGVGNYLIRKDELSRNDIKSALGLNVLITNSLGLLLIIFSTAIEQFYAKSDIGLLILILALNFFISPHIGIAKSLLARHFLFKRILIINIMGLVTRLCVTISLIFLGYSYFSLAIAAVIGSIVQLCFVAKLRSEEHVWVPHFKNIGNIAVFGVYVTFSNLLHKMSVTIPDLIIGKIGSMVHVALFSRAIGFLEFVQGTLVSGVRPVIMPYFSQQKRLGLNIEDPYLKACSMVGVILLPSLAVAGLASKPIIFLFFGNQWVESADLVSILCIWSVFRTLHVFGPSLLITHGYEKVLFVKALVIFVVTAVMVYMGYQFGLSGVAWGFTIAGLLDFIYTSFLMQLLVGLSFYKFLKCMLPNIIIALLCGGTTYLIDMTIDFDSANAFFSIALLVPIVGLVWLATSILLRHPIIIELSNIRGLEFFKKIKAKKL